MVKVAKELRFLKQKQSDILGRMMGDDQITRLQTGIEWFKETAVVLNDILDKQKQQIAKGKQKKSQKEKDVSFLNGHMKDLKRQNKEDSHLLTRIQGTNRQLENFFETYAESDAKEFNPF